MRATPSLCRAAFWFDDSKFYARAESPALLQPVVDAILRRTNLAKPDAAARSKRVENVCLGIILLQHKLGYLFL